MKCCAPANLLLLAALVSCGCAGPTMRDQRQPQEDVALLASVRETLRQADPNAIVGYVTETLPGSRLAAVSDLPLDQFRVGEIITFIDANQRRLTHGKVIRITSSQLHVSYQPPPRDGRAPRPGDLAVRFKTPPGASG